MNYEAFIQSINEYIALFEKGLKKEANANLTNLCKTLSSLPQADFDAIIKSFVEALCDSNAFSALKSRGNAEIPFQLKKPVQTWLLPRCEAHSMPELRWFYQLFQYDRNLSETAYTFLQQAYKHANCDAQTLEIVFNHNIDSLSYGLHELPSGLLYSKEEFDEIIQQNDAILSRNVIQQNIVDQYQTLKQKYLHYVNQ